MRNLRTTSPLFGFSGIVRRPELRATSVPERLKDKTSQAKFALNCCKQLMVSARRRRPSATPRTCSACCQACARSQALIAAWVASFAPQG